VKSFVAHLTPTFKSLDHPLFHTTHRPLDSQQNFIAKLTTRHIGSHRDCTGLIDYTFAAENLTQYPSANTVDVTDDRN
jgi:hypothetical protein